jgi:transposase
LAQLTFDRFHVVKLFNQAIEEVRRSEQLERAELKKTRWLWLKRPENLTKRQAEQLAALLRPSATGLQTAKAYQMKLSFADEFWSLPPALAEEYLRKWCRWAKGSQLEPMRRLARTL